MSTLLCPRVERIPMRALWRSWCHFTERDSVLSGVSSQQRAKAKYKLGSSFSQVSISVTKYLNKITHEREKERDALLHDSRSYSPRSCCLMGNSLVNSTPVLRPTEVPVLAGIMQVEQIWSSRDSWEAEREDTATDKTFPPRTFPQWLTSSDPLP